MTKTNAQIGAIVCAQADAALTYRNRKRYTGKYPVLAVLAKITDSGFCEIITRTEEGTDCRLITTSIDQLVPMYGQELWDAIENSGNPYLGSFLKNCSSEIRAQHERELAIVNKKIEAANHLRDVTAVDVEDEMVGWELVMDDHCGLTLEYNEQVGAFRLHSVADGYTNVPPEFEADAKDSVEYKNVEAFTEWTSQLTDLQRQGQQFGSKAVLHITLIDASEHGYAHTSTFTMSTDLPPEDLGEALSDVMKHGWMNGVDPVNATVVIRFAKGPNILDDYGPKAARDEDAEYQRANNEDDADDGEDDIDQTFDDLIEAHEKPRAFFTDENGDRWEMVKESEDYRLDVHTLNPKLFRIIDIDDQQYATLITQKMAYSLIEWENEKSFEEECKALRDSQNPLESVYAEVAAEGKRFYSDSNTIVTDMECIRHAGKLGLFYSQENDEYWIRNREDTVSISEQEGGRLRKVPTSDFVHILSQQLGDKRLRDERDAASGEDQVTRELGVCKLIVNEVIDEDGIQYTVWCGRTSMEIKEELYHHLRKTSSDRFQVEILSMFDY